MELDRSYDINSLVPYAHSYLFMQRLSYSNFQVPVISYIKHRITLL